MDEDPPDVSGYRTRLAVLEDCSAIARLIDRSAREVATSHYTEQQVEGALRGAFGVDTQLIKDGTYFVVADAGATLIACGGWSRRSTLFGGDQRADREPGELDPRRDFARIRAFFVDPGHLRKGIATLLLERCESAAREAGFSRFELMATLSGVSFYEARGYVVTKPVTYEMEPDLRIDFRAMRKSD